MGLFEEATALATWKKIVFVVVLCCFIATSTILTFYSIARDTFEYEYQENIADIEGFNGYVFYGFNGNTSTTTVYVDYVRDEDGENPDETKPIVAVTDFTIVSDEYVEYIYISDTVQYIDASAFYYCKCLRAIFVDEDNEYYTSVNGVLYNKDMTEIILRPICNGTYQTDEGLTDDSTYFVIPDTVTRIGNYCFYKCTDIIQIEIPDSVTEIGDMAFFACSNLWTVTLPENLQSIGADAFSYCTAMYPVMYIPASVTEIGDYAFYACSNLFVFYMGAESEEDIELGERWLPKSIAFLFLYVAPEAEYGKTYEEAVEMKAAIEAGEVEVG